MCHHDVTYLVHILKNYGLLVLATLAYSGDAAVFSLRGCVT